MRSWLIRSLPHVWWLLRRVHRSVRRQIPYRQAIGRETLDPGGSALSLSTWFIFPITRGVFGGGAARCVMGEEQHRPCCWGCVQITGAMLNQTLHAYDISHLNFSEYSRVASVVTATENILSVLWGDMNILYDINTPHLIAVNVTFWLSWWNTEAAGEADYSLNTVAAAQVGVQLPPPLKARGGFIMVMLRVHLSWSAKC